MIVVDCHMPGKDGFQVVEAIRDVYAATKVKIQPYIMGITKGDAGQREEQRGREAQVNEIVKKSVFFKKLEDYLEKLMFV